MTIQHAFRCLPEIGTPIHYTGDAANASGDGYVVSHHDATLYGGEAVTVILEDGREWRSLTSGTFSESVGRRFVVQIDRPKASPETILRMLREVADAKASAADSERKARAEAERLCTKGKALAALLIPESCPALIVARHMKDDSDVYTDYFASHSTEVVVLALSTHTRDNFKEMRKAAQLFEPTRHLAAEGIEHRQKYSMGSGYFLSGERYSKGSGWEIRKVRKGTESWSSEILTSLNGRHTLAAPAAR